MSFVNNKIFQLLLFNLLLSLILSSQPKWFDDISDDKYWVGVGLVDKTNIPPEENPTTLAFLTAVESIASQISINIESQMTGIQKDSIYTDSETGEMVASGTYFYTMQTNQYTFTQKMIILK